LAASKAAGDADLMTPTPHFREIDTIPQKMVANEDGGMASWTPGHRISWSPGIGR